MYCDWPILQRCCFCLPLRKGVLTIAYIKVIFSTLMIGSYSYSIHHNTGTSLLYNGSVFQIPAEICLVIYIAELIFSALLVYGTHKKSIRMLRTCFYFTISTMLMTVIIEIIEIVNLPRLPYIIERLIFCSVGFGLQLYMIVLLWSLIKKWEVDGPHVYDNQLHQFVEGQVEVEPNGIYNASTEPVEL